MAPIFGPGGVGVPITPTFPSVEAEPRPTGQGSWRTPPGRRTPANCVAAPRCKPGGAAPRVPPPPSAKHLAVEQLVPQPAVERRAVRVLPRAARRDVQRLRPDLRQPPPHRRCDEP